MPKKVDKNLIVSLDIGTSKVMAIVAECLMEGEIKIIGMGSSPSSGLKKGVVVNIEATVQSIQQAIEEAELMAGCQIHSVYAGIAGSHIKSLNSHGIVAISEHEVTQMDVDRVIDAAKAVAIPADQKILHILPQQFIIDSQEGIKEPIGMSGVRLETKIHMVTGSVSAAQNLIKCIRRCGLEVDDIILDQLASSYAVLNEDEKELGVCLIDIGGGTTDIAVFVNGSIYHTAVIPIAGDQVTNDITVTLRIPTASAQAIKLQHGCALTRLVDPSDTIEILFDRSTRQLARTQLAQVIEPRFEELFGLIQTELQRHGLEELIGSGIVITGGSAKMEGIIELAEEIFQLPARLGIPDHIASLVDVLRDPIYATSIGLILYGRQQQLERHTEQRAHEGLSGMWGRVKRWFQGNF